MSIIVIGIDLAKTIFAVHGVNEAGKAELVKPKVSREQLLPTARPQRAPKFVTPYRMSGKRGKNDAADAAAICEAVTRPQMRFVPIKEEHQQIILCLHRTRQGFVEARTATYNRLRALIAEFGIVLPLKVTCLRQSMLEPLNRLTDMATRQAHCTLFFLSLWSWMKMPITSQNPPAAAARKHRMAKPG